MKTIANAADFVCSPLPCVNYDYPLALGGWIGRNIAGCTFFVPLFAGYVAIWYNELNPTFTPGYRAIMAQLRSPTPRHTYPVAGGVLMVPQ